MYRFSRWILGWRCLMANDRKYEQGLAAITKPRWYRSLAEALGSLPPILRASYQDMAEAFSEVGPGPTLRAVVVDVEDWARNNDVPVYEAMYWLQRIANTHVMFDLKILGDEPDIVGFRPLMRIEHYQDIGAAGYPSRVAISIPEYGTVRP